MVSADHHEENRTVFVYKAACRGLGIVIYRNDVSASSRRGISIKNSEQAKRHGVTFYSATVRLPENIDRLVKLQTD